MEQPLSGDIMVSIERKKALRRLKDEGPW